MSIGLEALYMYVSGLAGLQLACITGAGGGRGWVKSGKRKGGGRRESICNKSPNWFNPVVTGSHKIPIGQSDNWRSRLPFYADMDILLL